MKFGTRLLGMLGCAALMTGGLFSTARADQSIDIPRADQTALFANTPTQITITVQVAADRNLLPTSVNLVRLDEQNNSASIVTRMYDDGTHGDALVGDGTFTSLITVNDPPETLRLAVTAAYKGSLLRVRSRVLDLPVVKQPTEADILQSLQIVEVGTQFFNYEIANGVAPDQARQDTIAFLKMQPGVLNAFLTADGQTINVVLPSGLPSLINTNLPGTKSQPALLLSPSLANTASRWTSLLFQDTATAFTGNAKALCIAPFFSSFAPNDETDNITGSITKTCAGSADVVKDSSGTVDNFKNLRKYGVISISSHGDLDASGQVVILTSEQATTLSTLAHLLDWALGRIENISGYWAITPKFISAYAGGGYPASIIYASCCLSTANDTMANAFLGNGAKTYMGYSKIVNTSFSYPSGTKLFQTLTDETKALTDRTAGKAFDSTGGKTDPGAPHAEFQLRGERDINLISNLVLNGGFETGDFTGWTPDTAPGYAKVVTESVSNGGYAARLGRWDQLYGYQGGFRGPPVAGMEPSGTDTMYQDVTLPSGVSSLTLTFDYNVVTFDGASYDWFDMRVLDVSNNRTLVQPINKVGGIISGSPSNWGLYYTTGWQTTTVDLTPYKGKTVRLYFGVTQDGYGDQCAAYVDKVSINCVP